MFLYAIMPKIEEIFFLKVSDNFSFTGVVDNSFFKVLVYRKNFCIFGKFPLSNFLKSDLGGYSYMTKDLSSKLPFKLSPEKIAK